MMNEHVNYSSKKKPPEFLDRVEKYVRNLELN